MNVLIAAPHPDDDLIGCGGSMAKHVKEGHRVSVVYMTSGGAGSSTETKEQLTRIREKEAEKACQVLGIDDLIFLRNEDGYLEVNRSNLIEIVRIIRDKKPSLIYMPHQGEIHRDHQTTHLLFREAARRAAGPWFQECQGKPFRADKILCYEIWKPLPEVSFAENITEFMELKINALGCHRSQLKDIAYDEAAKSLNRYRGITTGSGYYCECFQVLWINRI
jgi:N-acetylglucosamine malate deacetylase 1